MNVKATASFPELKFPRSKNGLAPSVLILNIRVIACDINPKKYLSVRVIIAEMKDKALCLS